ncbi:MAG: hypothetical protein KDE27_00135 [Planctomycetes bacterium]|nr:hypothetical protein [Planctomycetota bacterium]
MSPPTVAAVAGLTLAALLPAQSVPITVTQQGGATGFRWQPATGPEVFVDSPLFINATSASSVGAAGSALVMLTDVATIGVTVFEPPIGCATCWNSAYARVRSRHTAATPVAGVMRLTATSSCAGVHVYADVLEDGELELALPNGASVDVPAVLGPDPLRVHIGTISGNTGQPTCSSSVNAAFVPQPTKLRSALTPCQATLGAVLLEQPTASRLALHVADPAGSFGAIGIGGPPTVLFGTCLPATSPVGAILVTPGTFGVDLTVPLPAGIVGTFTFQYAEVGSTGQLMFSNAVVAQL